MTEQPFRGFQDLSQFDTYLQRQNGDNIQQQVQQQAPQRNWKYANRGTVASPQHAQFQGYQHNYVNGKFGPANQRLPDEEMKRQVAIKEQERMQQNQIFQQNWQKQQQNITVGNDHFVREGLWARSKETATPYIPYPIHARVWQGEEQFLADLELVEQFMDKSRVSYRGDIKCLVEGCNTPLINAEFVDETNKMTWPVSFIHYLGDHNNPPSRLFFTYITKAAQAIRAQYRTG